MSGYFLPRQVAALILGSWLWFTVVGCNSSTEMNQIGVLAPLTGGAASYGQNTRNGAELAVKHYAQSHPELKVQLKVEDSRGDPVTGVQAANRLLDVNHVVSVIGCVTSGVTLAVSQTMNEHRVPIISPGASTPKLTDAGEYVFRTWPSDVFEAGAMAKHLAEANLKKIGILRINNEYGLSMEDAVKKQLKTLDSSAEIADSETFEQGAREVRAQVQHIKDSDSEAIYFIGFPEAAVVFGRAYEEAGLKLPVFSTVAFEDPQVASNVGKALDGTVYTKPLAASSKSDTFTQEYRKAYGSAPGVTSDTAYDATMLVLGAMSSLREQNQPINGQGIHDQLLQVRDYQGASGILSFDRNGDVLKPIGLFTLKDGKYVQWKKP